MCVFAFILFGVHCFLGLQVALLKNQIWDVFAHHFFQKDFPQSLTLLLLTSQLHISYTATGPWHSVHFLLIFFFSLFFRLDSISWLSPIHWPLFLRSPTCCRAQPVNLSFQRFNSWALTFPFGSFVVSVSLLCFPTWLLTTFLCFWKCLNMFMTVFKNFTSASSNIWVISTRMSIDYFSPWLWALLFVGLSFKNKCSTSWTVYCRKRVLLCLPLAGVEFCRQAGKLLDASDSTTLGFSLC